jgi:hypothetical protein
MGQYLEIHGHIWESAPLSKVKLAEASRSHIPNCHFVLIDIYHQRIAATDYHFGVDIIISCPIILQGPQKMRQTAGNWQNLDQNINLSPKC